VRVLLIHRYFWPDVPPYASMLRVIARRLAADGHQVEVLTSQPGYKADSPLPPQPAREGIDGFEVRRLGLPADRGRGLARRLFNIAYFPLRVLLHCLLHGRYDVIMASTAPPVVVGFAAALGARLTGGRFLYHCMDIHPEIGRLSGEFRQPLLFGLLRRLDDWSCRQASHVIVLSGDMAAALRERPGRSADIRVINNFSLPDFDSVGPDLSDATIASRGDRQCRLLFAGNIGRFQGLEAFIDAMAYLEHRPEIELVFLGEGTALAGLRTRAGERAGRQIKFVPHQPACIARRWMSRSDLGIVSLTPGIYRYAFPSKTMTYLEEGLPLLVAVEPDSELARFVADKGIGIAVPPGDPTGIARALEHLLDSGPSLPQLSARARSVAAAEFSEAAVLPRWSTLFMELAK